MPNNTKLIKSHIKAADLNSQSASIIRKMREARHELQELPITYITHYNIDTCAIVPLWLAQWVEANAEAVLASIALDTAN